MQTDPLVAGHLSRRSRTRLMHQFKSRCIGQHRRSPGLHWPEVILVVGKAERVRGIPLGLTPEKINLEALCIDGRFNLPFFFALKRPVGNLQHSQYRGVHLCRGVHHCQIGEKAARIGGHSEATAPSNWLTIWKTNFRWRN